MAAAGAELQKLRNDPVEIASRAVQPALWLLLFGQVMMQVRGLNSGSLPYLDFLSAGILDWACDVSPTPTREISIGHGMI